jgi:hypothetical protein
MTKRTYKFRAWDKNNNKMIYPSKKYTNGGLLDWFEDEELMEFTGLLDKNGKEIYEGDIVKTYNSVIEKIFYENGAFIRSQDDYPLNKYLLITTNQQDIEVIGNIYENKDLLK